MNLTPHFTVAEFEVTNTGLENFLPEDLVPRARALCSAVLEPWRERVGPLKVTSGFRSRAVNRAIPGASCVRSPQGLELTPDQRAGATVAQALLALEAVRALPERRGGGLTRWLR